MEKNHKPSALLFKFATFHLVINIENTGTGLPQNTLGFQFVKKGNFL